MKSSKRHVILLSLIFLLKCLAKSVFIKSLLRCENTVSAHARVPSSARAEIPFRLHETSSDSQARLAGLKILARFEHTVLGFSARAELRPGLNPSPCNRQFGFQRICFRSRPEITARDEIRHVIGP